MVLHEFHPCRWQRHINGIEADPEGWFRSVFAHDVYGYADVYRNYFERFQEVMVARSKNNGTTTKAGSKAQWTTFVEIPLGASSWEDIHKAFGDADSSFNAVQELLESGYRLSLSHNDQSDAVICSVTCKDEGSVNAGKTFSAFAGSWTDALITALYKHFVIAEGVWSGDGSTVNRPRFG